MLARITNMRGVDLAAFDFDYDLTWMAFFLTADGKVLGRFGGREDADAEKALSLKGLAHAMRSALEEYKEDPDGKPAPRERPFRTVEQYPAARRVKADACIHCHQVHDFHREWLIDKGEWSREKVWVYPPPKNLGLLLDPDRGDRLADVAPDSPAAKAGLQAGDILERLGGRRVSSYGDVQHVLHEAPAVGELEVAWKRGGEARKGTLDLKEGWRESDISWRGSMWGLEPQAHVYGQDLSPAEKRKLGLSPKRLAFRQGNFVPPRAREAGIRSGDIIVGIDGKDLEMTVLQFNAWVRLTFKDGDRIVYDVLRDGKRLEVPLTLRARASRR